MKRKKVLIITYYWPPSGGAGVQRWLKFSKYLPEFGWDPVIYTVENPEAPIEDPSLIEDIPEDIKVIKTHIWEPYRLYKQFIGEKHAKIKHGFLSERKKPSLRQKLSVWIRGNLFIPDARKFWIRPSIKYLKKYLSDHPVDVIISTGPPHSTHLIALGICDYFKIPWLADFRDPWTNIDFYKDLGLTACADRKHRKFEHRVLSKATQILTIGWTLAREFEALGAKNVKVITNGFDQQDFSKPPELPKDPIYITHIGAMNKDRNPHVLWSTLEKLRSSQTKLIESVRIKLIGDHDFSVYESIRKHGLQHMVQFEDYLPHRRAIDQLFQSHILLLALNNSPNQRGILPGKLFEYLASQRTILAIGPEDGDTARVLRETNAGFIVGFHDEEKLTGVLKDLLSQLHANPDFSPHRRIEKYDRRNLTHELSGFLNKLSSEE